MCACLLSADLRIPYQLPFISYVSSSFYLVDRIQYEWCVPLSIPYLTLSFIQNDFPCSRILLLIIIFYLHSVCLLARYALFVASPLFGAVPTGWGIVVYICRVVECHFCALGPKRLIFLMMFVLSVYIWYREEIIMEHDYFIVRNVFPQP